MSSQRRKPSQRGSTIIEFAFIALLLMIVILAGIEFDRMVLVYTTVANSAKVGVRYAIVHGNNRTGVGDPASGPGDNPDPVYNVIRNFASAGVLNVAALPKANCADNNAPGVCITYPNGTNSTGSPVRVRVIYPYDPFVALPLSVNLRSTAEGIIMF